MDRTELSRKDLPWLLSLLLIGLVLLIAFYGHAHRLTHGRDGVPLDDAWIHFQFARNLARGDGFAFNPGEPTAGSTAPLWTVILAAAYRVGARFPIAGQALSGISFLAVLPATFTLGKRLTRRCWLAWLSAALVALNGRMVWAGLSALETPLFTALSLTAILAHLQDRSRPAGRYRALTVALFGLAALSRPEGYLLFALAMADLAYVKTRQKSPPRRTVVDLLQASAIFGLIVLPYLIFSWRTSGHLLPNTYHAKAVASSRPSVETLSIAARYLILDNALLLPAVLLGGIALIARAPLISVWSFGLPLIYAFLQVTLYQHGRYLMPLIPLNAVMGAVGLVALRNLARRRGWFQSIERPVLMGSVVTILILTATAWRLPAMARQYALNVDNINEMHVDMAYWVRDHVDPGTPVALNDIGAIAYIAQRPVIDLAGLVTPEVIPILRRPDRETHLAQFLEERDVHYVVIFPNWFPELAAHSEFERLHQERLETNTIAGGERMAAYYAHWQR